MYDTDGFITAYYKTEADGSYITDNNKLIKIK